MLWWLWWRFAIVAYPAVQGPSELRWCKWCDSVWVVLGSCATVSSKSCHSVEMWMRKTVYAKNSLWLTVSGQCGLPKNSRRYRLAIWQCLRSLFSSERHTHNSLYPAQRPWRWTFTVSAFRRLARWLSRLQRTVFQSLVTVLRLVTQNMKTERHSAVTRCHSAHK